MLCGGPGIRLLYGKQVPSLESQQHALSKDYPGDEENQDIKTYGIRIQGFIEKTLTEDQDFQPRGILSVIYAGAIHELSREITREPA